MTLKKTTYSYKILEINVPFAVLAENLCSVSNIHIQKLITALKALLGDLMSCLSVCGYRACTWYTYISVGTHNT